MKRILALMVFGFLTACTENPPAVTPAEVFRNPSAQIASQTNVTADRMAGGWVIRQRFASQAVPLERFELSVLPDGALQMALPISQCLHGVCVEDAKALFLLEPTGPGRWSPQGPNNGAFDDEIWVMWMDFDSRTAAIGTPSGEFGWIMDKNATGGSDRITAARDIMEWFGYDTSRLQEVSR